MGTPVSRADLQPGDLVFFCPPVSHVGIYVGDGQMIDAGNEDTGVVQRTVDMEGYDFARRIASPRLPTPAVTPAGVRARSRPPA